MSSNTAIYAALTKSTTSASGKSESRTKVAESGLSDSQILVLEVTLILYGTAPEMP